MINFTRLLLINVLLSCLLSSTVFAADPLVVGLDNLEAGHWYEYNNPKSKMSSVDPCPAANCGFMGAQSSIMIAWGGGAFDTARNRLFIWGGGHNDYAGNELYYFDMEIGEWTRVTDPSTDTPFVDFDGGYYPDGLPQSRHTYNHIQFDPVRNSFIALINAAPYGPGGIGDTYDVDAFNMNTLSWERKATRPTAPSANAYKVGSGSAYDADTGLFWHYMQNEGDLASYNPATNSWQQYGPVVNNLYTTAAIDLSRNLMVMTGAGHLMYVDLDNPGPGAVSVRNNSSQTIEGKTAPGFVYDQVQQLFVAWGGSGDPTAVYTLNPDDWSWNRIAPAAGNTVVPSGAQRFGTYGRFRYVPEYNVFVLVNSTEENVYVYKLSDSPGTASTRPAAPENLIIQSVQ